MFVGVLVDVVTRVAEAEREQIDGDNLMHTIEDIGRQLDLDLNRLNLAECAEIFRVGHADLTNLGINFHMLDVDVASSLRNGVEIVSAENLVDVLMLHRSRSARAREISLLRGDMAQLRKLVAELNQQE